MTILILSLLSVSSVYLAKKAFASSNFPILEIPLAIYFMNFLLGHLILISYRLIFKPSSLYLGDYRFFKSGTDIKFIIALNFLQFNFVCLGILIGRNNAKEIQANKYQRFEKDLTWALILMTLIGWIGNIGVISGNINLFSAFHPFELFGTAWLVSGFRLKEVNRFVVIVLSSFHLIWAIFFFHSKSEAFLVLISLVIRFIHSKSKITIRQLLSVVLIGILLFPYIQEQKGIFTFSKIQSLLTSQGVKLPYAKSFALTLLQRFDGADSITDAYSAGAGSWYSPLEYVQIIFFKLIPNISFLVGDSFGENTLTSRSLGQLWNDQVRPQSLINITRGVPVTYGPMAEGYALSGLLLGLSLCLIFGIIIRKFCSACYSNNLFAVSCGLYFISHLENLQNSLGSTILMTPKMLECFLLVRLLQMALSKKYREH